MWVVPSRYPLHTPSLANHLRSFAGDKDRIDISNTFMQPFAAYPWPSSWTVSAQTGTSYNLKLKQWSVPINVAVFKLGKLPVSVELMFLSTLLR